MDQQSISVIKIIGARGKRSKSIHNLVRRLDVEIAKMKSHLKVAEDLPYTRELLAAKRLFS